MHEWKDDEQGDGSGVDIPWVSCVTSFAFLFRPLRPTLLQEKVHLYRADTNNALDIRNMYMRKLAVSHLLFFGGTCRGIRSEFEDLKRPQLSTLTLLTLTVYTGNPTNGSKATDPEQQRAVFDSMVLLH